MLSLACCKFGGTHGLTALVNGRSQTSECLHQVLYLLLFIELQLVGSDVAVVWIPTPHRPESSQDSQEEEEEEEEKEKDSAKPIQCPDSVHTSNAPHAIFSFIAQLHLAQCALVQCTLYSL